jgi:hypothetical protein
MKRTVEQWLATEKVKELIAMLFLLFLPAVFFWRETLALRTLAEGDALFWFYPAYQFVAEQLKAGKLPLWNPYLYSGTPLFAQWQAGVFDPLNWLFLLGVTSRMMTLVQELAYAIALLGMFRYTRSLQFNRRASAVSAVIYTLSGFAVARVIYPGFLHIFALTPLVLYTIDRLRQRPAWRTAAFGAMIVAWQLFAAHPQPVVYCALLAAAYMLFRLRKTIAPALGAQASLPASLGAIPTDPSRPTSPPPAGKDACAPRADSQAKWLFIRQCALVYLGGACLAAIQLLPAAGTARQSVRQAWPYELFAFNSLHPISLLVTFFPFWHGQGRGVYQMGYWGPYWHQQEAQIYLGVIALALAGGGAYLAWRGRWSIGRFWSVVGVCGLLLSLGGYIEPLARLLYHVPLINQFRSPNRHWMEVVFAVAVLAGFAVNQLLCVEQAKLQRHLAQVIRITALALTILCALVGGFVLWRKAAAEQIILAMREMNRVAAGFFQQGGPEFYLPIITAVVLYAVLSLFLCSARRTHWYALLLVMMLADYQLYAYFAPISNDEPKLETLIGRALPPTLAAKQSEREPLRYQQMLNPATGEFNPFWLYGHEFATGYDPILNTRYKTFSGIDEAGRSYLPSLLKAEDRTLDLLNVRYILLPPNFLKPGAQPSEVGLDDASRWRELPNDSLISGYNQMKVYENLRALPRAWLVTRVQQVDNEYDQLRLIRGELKDAQEQAFDPHQLALLEPHAAQQPWVQGLLQPTSTEPRRTAQIIARENDSLLLETEATADALLVLSEMAYPGWRARVDGQDVEWYRVNYLLCGVPLKAGRHRVEFSYQPDIIKIGAMVSITTALGLVGLIMWERRRSKDAGAGVLA